MLNQDIIIALIILAVVITLWAVFTIRRINRVYEILSVLIEYSYRKNLESLTDRSEHIAYQKEVWKLLHKQVKMNFFFTPIESYLKGTIFEGLDYEELRKSYVKPKD